MQAPLSIHTSPALSLLEVPAPPPGYRFERLLALTYSLDARVAIALLAAAFGRSNDFEEGEPQLDLQSLNAFEARSFVRRVLAKSLFLVQHSSDPIKGSVAADLFSLLQDRVFTVCVSSGSSTRDRPLVNFHPKLLLAEFSKQKLRWLRVYLGSRNLSLGAAREVAVLLDFAPEEIGQPRLSGASILRPLDAFLAATHLQAYSRSKALSGTKRHAEAIAEWRTLLQSMARVRRTFITPKGVKGATISVQWPGSAPIAHSLAKDLRRARACVIVSPWLDNAGAAFIERTLPISTRPRLWTLDSELAHLQPLQKRAAEVVTEAGDTLYERGVEKEGAEIGFESRLHAKAYAIDVGHAGALWLGSANFTRPGLGLDSHPAANFELLLRLECGTAPTRWLGRLPIQSLKAALARAKDASAADDGKPNPLDWLKAEWIDYPRLLRIELGKPRSAQAVEQFCQHLKVVATDASGESQQLGTVPWQRLWRAGALDLRTGLIDPKLQLAALLQLAPSGPSHPVVYTHAPIPDDVASLRASKYVKARVDLDAALERLAQIQGGLIGVAKGRNGSGGKRNAASYIAGLRLERIFLRLLDDDFEDIASDIDEIISCLKRESSGAEHEKLAQSLSLVVKRAARGRPDRG